MSDYMYLLDSLLSREQSQLLTEIQNAAKELGVALYLTGGAMRDMLGGFPIRDLDFTFEELLPSKLARVVARNLPDLEIHEDAVRKSVELRMAPNVTASLRMAYVAKVSKAGGTPKITPAHILEDLSRRDFTMNAIAISLAQASRGLIRDPMNGVSDLKNSEVRVCYSQAFFDEPIRMPRAIRLRHRLGFQLEERTQRYFQTGVDEGWIKTLSPAEWHQELRLICEESKAAEILQEAGTFGLLPFPAASMNLEGLERFQKLRLTMPGRASHWPLFLHVVSEKMKPKERAAFVAAFGLTPADFEAAKKLKPQVAKLEAALKSPSLRKPSQVYNAVSAASPVELLYLLYETEQRVIQDRVQNYFEKYLPAASEITDAQVEATGAKPGSSQFQRAKSALITARLNAQPPRPEEPAPPPTPIPTAAENRVARQ